MDETHELKPLPPEAVYRPARAENFGFTSTADLDHDTDFIGHGRALEALQFGMGIRQEGFNLYLLGPGGAGKHDIARSFLEKRAAAETIPEEWCYVNNFASPDTPSALRLPPGRGVRLREDMIRLVENLRSAIPSAFESENYRGRKNVIEHEVKERQEKSLRGTGRGGPASRDRSGAHSRGHHHGAGAQGRGHQPAGVRATARRGAPAD